jgi:hypothetical protein
MEYVLKEELEEVMASYEESINSQKRYLAALTKANERIQDLEAQLEEPTLWDYLRGCFKRCFSKHHTI